MVYITKREQREFNRFFEQFILPKLKLKDLDLDKVLSAISFELGIDNDKLKFCFDELEKQGKIKIIKIITIPDQHIDKFLDDLKKTNEELKELDKEMERIESFVKKDE